MTAQDEFLKDLEPQEDPVDAFDAPLQPEEKPKEEVVMKKGDDEDDVPEAAKNRRHRRLEEKLRDERESNIALAAKLEVISEAKKFTGENADYLKGVERIYGTDSPEALAATELLKTALQGVEKRATETALEQFRREQQASIAAEKEASKRLNSMLEEIEDEFNVDLTSPKAEDTRKAFFRHLEKLSPKDSNGDILHYADHFAVWENLRDKASNAKRDENTRAKDLSARSMATTATADGTKDQGDAAWKALRERMGW